MDSDVNILQQATIDTFAMSGSSVVAIIVIALLLMVAGVISAAVFSFRMLSQEEREDMEDEESPADEKINKLINSRERLFISLNIWNAVICVAIIVLGTTAFNQMLDFSRMPVLGFILEILIFLTLFVLFAEILPKLLVYNHPMRFLQKVVPFVYALDWIVRPVAAFVDKTRFLASNHARKKTGDVSVDDLSKALELTSDELSEEKEMLQGIIDLYNKTAVEIMTPRVDICNLDIKSSFREVIHYIIEVGYSRIPVYQGNRDNIRGILYSKDLLPYLEKHAEFRWQTLIRPAFFVTENKMIDDLLEDFRINKIHMAIVVNEFGGTCGIVTMEDILEEIVGEIDDEYDDEETKFTALPDGSIVFDGKILLSDFFKATHTEPKDFGNLTEEMDTLAGLILEIKGDFPAQGEVIRYHEYVFTILETDQRRILKIQFTKESKEESDDEEER